MLEHALHYAAIGWPVFPCGKDKKPLSPHGFKDATTDEVVLSGWWTRWPDAMIGLPTGFPSGIWAVDCDGSGKGTAEFEQFCAANGGLVDTLYQDTPSGGRHYLFQWTKDAPVRNTVKKLCPHVDTRGEGGYIVLAPSVRADGNTYVWGNPEIAPQPAPMWLIKRIIAKPEYSPSLSPYAQAALNAEAEKVAAASEGERNNTLNTSAFAIGTLVGGGKIPAETARDALFQAAMKAGLNEREAVLTIQSGLEAGAERPRSVPAQADAFSMPKLTISSPLGLIVPEEYRGTLFIENFPPPYTWLLEDSLRDRSLGVIAGPPGAGKGTAAVQLCVAVASCMPWLEKWDVATGEGSAVFISGEDDMITLHQRFYHAIMALPESERYRAANRLYGISVRGMVNLCQTTPTGIVPTQSYYELDALMGKIRPRLLVLDTLARFSGVEENDNPDMTGFCAMAEMLIERHACNIVLLHHTNKNSGDCVTNVAQMHSALSQSAIRGASALAGAARWAFLMAPMDTKLAVSKLGPQAEGKYDGSFLAVRVAMKNAGRPESRHFYGRDEHGLLVPAVPAPDTAQLDKDAEAIVREIQNRTENKGKPLCRSLRGCEFGWGTTRAKNAVDYAIQQGLVTVKEKGKQAHLFISEHELEAGEKAPPSPVSYNFNG